MNHFDAFDGKPFTPPAATGYCARCHTDCTRAQPCVHCESQRHVDRHDLPRDVLESYRRRVPGANDPAVYDATAQYAHHLLRHWLEIACAVLEDEGVDARTRHRVLASVAYASVSPPDIVQRDRMMTEQAKMVAAWPPKPPPRRPVLAASAAQDEETVCLTAPVTPPCYITLDPETPHWEQVVVYKVTGDGPFVAWLGLSDTQRVGLIGAHLMGGVVTEDPRDA